MSVRFNALKLQVAPVLESVSLVEAKAQLRITESDEDTFISSLIVTAREWAEEYTRRAFITQTWEARYQGWVDVETANGIPSDRMFVLPKPPLISVSSVKYLDNSGNEQTVDPTNYYVEAMHMPGTVIMKSAFGAPLLSQDVENPVRITFVAGYGVNGTFVPSRVKQAMLLAISTWFENRSAVVEANQAPLKVPMSAETLLDSLRLKLI